MNFTLLFILTITILIFYWYICSYKKKITEKTIWTYWDQGKKNIPPFSKLCIKTWKDKNPKHKVIVIDKKNVYNYLDKKDLPPNWEKIDKVQHKSDFVRIALLAKYGGIWMDLCIICIKPINSVFTQTKSLEGFSYRHNSNTKDLSMYENWFITGKKDSEIIKTWHKEFLYVFGNHSSANDIDESYFNGVDYQNLLHYHPESYLTMNRVLLKCIQKNDQIKYLFENDSTLLGAEETAFIHYMYFGWDVNNIEKLFEENEEFITMLNDSGTPLLKFTGEWNKYLNQMDMRVFKNNKNSVLYKLLNYKTCKKNNQPIARYETYNNNICGGYDLPFITNRKPYKLVTSFTTSPTRIFKTDKTIYSILHQTYTPDYMILNIPEVFARTNEKYIIPDFIKNNKNIKINVINMDYGPATKLVGSIFYIPNNQDTWIVVHDDDQMYLQKTLEQYTKYIDKYNNKRMAFSISGFSIDNDKIIRHNKDMEKISFVEGYQTFCIHRSVFEDDFIPYIKNILTNKEAFQSDDLTISNYLAMKKIDVRKIYNDDVNCEKWWGNSCILDYGNQDDALRFLAASNANDPLGGHFDKYLRVIQYLKDTNNYYI